MLELYGSQWESQNGHVDDDVFPAWVVGLAEFSDEQIENGLALMDQEGADWPPNLIKFRRLCGTQTTTSHQTFPPALPRPACRYSVMRIERAKQIALMGRAFSAASDTNHMVMDWTDEDERELSSLISKFEAIPDEDPKDTEVRINNLVDHHEFSHGTHYANTQKRS